MFSCCCRRSFLPVSNNCVHWPTSLAMLGLTILSNRQDVQEKGREELPCLWLKWEFREGGVLLLLCVPQCSRVTDNPYTHCLSHSYQPINVNCADKQININKEFLTSKHSRKLAIDMKTMSEIEFPFRNLGSQVWCFAFGLSRGRGIFESSRPSWSTWLSSRLARAT